MDEVGPNTAESDLRDGDARYVLRNLSWSCGESPLRIRFNISEVSKTTHPEFPLGLILEFFRSLQYTNEAPKKSEINWFPLI